MSEQEEEQLRAQIRELTLRLQELTETVRKIPRQPKWLTNVARDTPVDLTNPVVSDTMKYHERASRKQASSHYFSFTAIYGLFAASTLVGSSYHLWPYTDHIIIFLIYLFCIINLLSCVVVQTIRRQLNVELFAIFTSVMSAITQSIYAILVHQPAGAITTLLFWGSMVWVQIYFMTSIPGRVSQREVTLRLIDKFEQEEQSEKSGDESEPK